MLFPRKIVVSDKLKFDLELCQAFQRIGVITFSEVLSRYPQIEDAISSLRGSPKYYILDSEPSIGNVREAANELADSELVIGIGGGGVMDLAKVMAKYTNSPLFLVPTIAGSGAEVTHEAVIKNDVGRKEAQFDEDFLATAVYSCWTIQRGAPIERRYVSLVDAFVSCYEVLYNPVADSFARRNALSGIGILEKNIPNIALGGMFADKENAEASIFSGFAFGNAGTGVAHAISYLYAGKMRHAEAIACIAPAYFAEQGLTDKADMLGKMNDKYGIAPAKLAQNSVDLANVVMRDERHMRRSPQFNFDSVVSVMEMLDKESV